MSLLAILHYACETADIAWTCPQTLAGAFVADAIPHSQGAGCSSACFEWSRSGRFSHEVCPFTLLARSHVCYLALPVLSPVPISTWHSETLHKLASRTIARPLSHAGGARRPTSCLRVARVRCCIGVRALLTVDSVGLNWSILDAPPLSTGNFGWCFSALRLPGTCVSFRGSFAASRSCCECSYSTCTVPVRDVRFI